MVAVNTFNGIEYGFRLMGYFFLVLLIGGAAVWMGLGLVDSGPAPLNEDSNQSPSFDVGYFIDVIEWLVGILLVFAGGLTLWAGVMGGSYKMIADAVERGNEASS
jgi:hypothetical protein